MVYFDKQIEDTIVANPLVITLANFTGGGALTSWGVFVLQKLSISGAALNPIPTFITVNATVGSTTVKSDNTPSLVIGSLRLVYHEDVTYYYEGNDIDDKFASVKLAAAATTITLTFKDDEGVDISVPGNFQKLRYRARILGV